MSLENRVETLEHELKILKNEIESTLLEIQNQVLIHYYPMFRAEETVTARDQLPFVEVPAKSPSIVQSKEVAHSRAGIDVEPAQPKTREVSLNAIKGKAELASPLLQPAATRFKREVVALDDDDDDDDDSAETDDDEAYPVPALSQLALTHLAKWVNDSVDRIGKARTREMIESAVDVTQSTPAILDALRQLLDLSDETDEPAQVTTKDLMDVLLKFNKVVDHVAKLIAA